MTKYLNWHNSIIDRARSRKLDGYCEGHHVVPRSMGGTNEKSNIVKLTYREHFLVHWLLVKIYKDNDVLRRKMQYALHRMCFGKNWKHKGRIVAGWQYEIARLETVKVQRGSKKPGTSAALKLRPPLTPEQIAKLQFARNNRPPEVEAISRAKQAAKLKGRKHTQEELMKARIARENRSSEAKALANEKRRLALKGRKRPPEVGIKVGAALKGRKFSKERCANISAATRGKKKPKVSLALTGRKLSLEHRANISAGLKLSERYRKGVSSDAGYF